MENEKAISPTILSPTEIEDLIDKSLEFELKQDFESQRQVFSAVWQNLDDEPEIDYFSELQLAYFSRIIGNFLLKHGESKNIFNFIDRGREYLGRSERLFLVQDKADEAARSNILTGFAYWIEKRFDEFKIFLEGIEEHYKSKFDNPIYSLIQVNWLVYYWKTNQQQKSLELIKNNGKYIEKFASQKVLNQFYNESGLIARYFKNYDGAIIAYRKAISLSLEIEDFRSVAQRLNNLAYLYLIIGEYILALNCANESIRIYESLGDEGWLAPGYDTKGQILYADKKYPECLEAVDTSLRYFKDTPISKESMDALFLKVKCLLKLKKHEAAKYYFNTVQSRTFNELGDEISAKRYELELKKEFNSSIENVFCADPSPDVVRVRRPASDNLRSFIVNQNNLVYLHVSAEFAENYLFRHDAAIICVEKNGYLDQANLVLLHNGQQFVVGEVFYKKGYCFAEDTFTQEVYNLQRTSQIGRIVAISDLSHESDEVLFYEA